jgi:hypothetical protein
MMSARNNCVKSGWPAVDLWLGPCEVQELQQYLRTLTVYSQDLVLTDGMIIFNGLVVRFAADSGVRVGVTAIAGKALPTAVPGGPLP